MQSLFKATTSGVLVIGSFRWCRAAILILYLLLGGCTSLNWVAVRKVPRNPLEQPLRLLSRTGPRPTGRTTQLLRRYDLDRHLNGGSDKLLAEMQQVLSQEPTTENYYAYAELSYIAGKKAQDRGEIGHALDFYGTSVAHSYFYLFDESLGRYRNAYDPQFRRACDIYNGALEETLRLIQEEGHLRPGYSYRVHTPHLNFDVSVVARGKWKPDELEKFEFVSDYKVTGLTNHHRTYGLGVPLIAVRQSKDSDAHDTRVNSVERYYPSGVTFPVTALLKVLPSRRVPGTREMPRSCVLELLDPLQSTDVQLAGHVVPLESDFSTPLAYFLDNPQFRDQNLATLGLLNSEKLYNIRGLYMLESYDAGKIPVLMVHGLWSSPVTWMEMFNDLRASRDIRDAYQFWFYLYPSGQPFWISAAQLRRDLKHIREVLDPRHRSAAMDQIVLVGHSMGGLVSKLQTVSSGDVFWKTVSERPFNQLRATDEVRRELAETLFFEPNPSVRRVITIATPHRGSEFSNSATRWLGHKLIALPNLLAKANGRLRRENPNYFRDDNLLDITTSIDSLAADSPIFPVVLESPKAPWVHYHNIVGKIDPSGWFGKISNEGDGVVDLSSARLQYIESEIVVPADHLNVHRHPRSVLEVRRILREHLNGLRAGRAYLPYPVRPAWHVGKPTKP